MAKYAKTTSVPVKRSRQSIQDLFEDYGIDEFFFAKSPRGEGIGFCYEQRTYKHNVSTPERTEKMTDRQFEQALRQRWRILFMSLKMKLEQIMDGGISFEDQFLAQMCLPDGSTVAEFMELPQNSALLEKTQMPKMLTA